MKLKPVFFGISLLFLIPSIVSLLLFGLQPNIDFTGGSLLELKIEDESVQVAVIKEQLGPIYDVESVQPLEGDLYILRGAQISNSQKQEVLSILKQKYQNLEEVRFESIGPILGKELVAKTLAAVFIVSIVIILYVWHQFDDIKFGFCAITGMFHDSIILLGIYSLLGHFYGIEVDVLFVTALLTTLSFSIHDTIVIYDRIKELKQKHSDLDLEQTANLAVWETLARSINNSITIILMLASLVLMGGSTIRWFVVALLIGAIAGTYSSTFTAVPMLVLWEEIEQKWA